MTTLILGNRPDLLNDLVVKASVEDAVDALETNPVDDDAWLEDFVDEIMATISPSPSPSPSPSTSLNPYLDYAPESALTPTPSLTPSLTPIPTPAEQQPSNGLIIAPLEEGEEEERQADGLEGADEEAPLEGGATTFQNATLGIRNTLPVRLAYYRGTATTPSGTDLVSTSHTMNADIFTINGEIAFCMDYDGWAQSGQNLWIRPETLDRTFTIQPDNPGVVNGMTLAQRQAFAKDLSDRLVLAKYIGYDTNPQNYGGAMPTAEGREAVKYYLTQFYIWNLLHYTYYGQTTHDFSRNRSYFRPTSIESGSGTYSISNAQYESFRSYMDGRINTFIQGPNLTGTNYNPSTGVLTLNPGQRADLTDTRGILSHYELVPGSWPTGGIQALGISGNVLSIQYSTAVSFTLRIRLKATGSAHFVDNLGGDGMTRPGGNQELALLNRRDELSINIRINPTATPTPLPTPPNIVTKARDSKTSNHAGTIGTNESIIDTVTLTGLKPNTYYALRGRLYNGTTGQFVTGTGGTEIRVEQGFTTGAGQTSHVHTMTFSNLDTRGLAGNTIIVYQELFEGSIHNPRVAAHMDASDREQAIYYPKIVTKARDFVTGNHTGTVGTNQRIVDTVTLTGLAPNTYYAVRGTLFNTITNQIIPGIQVEMGFTTGSNQTTHQIEMTFNNVNTTALAGGAIVVYQALHVTSVNNPAVAEHKDRHDANQTITYPEPTPLPGRGELEVLKVDEIDQTKTLQGAGFQLWRIESGIRTGVYWGVNGNGDAIFSGGANTLFTDSNGIIKFLGLAPGTYELIEVIEPTGYVRDTTIHTITVGSAEIVKRTLTNMPILKTLELTKVNANNSSQFLAGAEYVLINSSNQYCTNGSGNATWGSEGAAHKFTTNAAGKITFPRVPPGTYRVKEVKAPDGYILDPTEHTVVVTASSPNIIGITRTNEENPGRGEIEILKVDENDQSKTLQDAGFQLWRIESGTRTGVYWGVDGNGDAIFSGGVNTLFTDSNGIIRFSGLAPGTYELIEVIEPAGYVIDSTIHTITVGSAEVVKRTLTNKEILKILELKKVDAGNASILLEGAEYILMNSSNQYCINGSGDAVWGPEAQAHVFTTNGAGKITFPRVTPGTYHVQEVKAPDGYILDPTVHTVVITASSSNVVEIVRTNEEVVEELEELIDLVVSKAWSDEQGNALSMGDQIFTSVTFQLYANGIAVPGRILVVTKDAWTTWEGKFTDLPVYDSDGVEIEYSVEEIGVTYRPGLPDEHKIKFEVVYRPVSTRGDGDLGITVTNKLLGRIMIIKKDEDGNALSDVEFKLEETNKDGTIKAGGDVRNIIVDSTGKAVVEDLKAGWYILTEVKTANGHQLLKEPIKITIPYHVDDPEFAGTTGTMPHIDGAKAGGYYYHLTYTIQNGQNFDIPNSGGIGVYWFYIIGIFWLGLLSTYCFTRKKRKRVTN